MILKAKNLNKVYGSKANTYTALDNIEFEMPKGEFLGIMGPSGAGKTTLLNLVATIDKPSDGEIFIADKEITKLNDNEVSKFRRKDLGFIFQEFNLLDTMNLFDNIALPLALSNVESSLIEKKVIEISSILGIENILKKFPYEVSGGQKQRCAAARAFVHNPKLILADEPTGALDSKSSSELLNYLSKMNKENGASIMMVTHDPFAASYCDRVLFIKDGKIYISLNQSGNKKDFFDRIMDVLKSMGGNSHGVI